MALKKLNNTDYPNIDPAEVGRYSNVVYGELEDVRIHAIVSGAASHILSDLTVSTTSFDVFDVSFYPAAPFTIQISDERMRVTNVATNTFTVTRAYDGTTAAAHTENSFAYEVLTEYVYIAANHAVKSIDDVFIDGIKQLTSTYTAYTGQAGDAHSDWPGIATIAFATDAILTKQRNATSTAEDESGEEITAAIKQASDTKLTDGLSTEVSITSDFAWVEFDAGSGTINHQVYTANISNDSGSTVSFRLVATEANILKQSQIFSIADGDSGTYEIDRKGGIWADEFKVVAFNGTIKVSSMYKTTNREIDPNAAGFVSRLIPKSQINYDDPYVAWVEYDSTALGVAVLTQYHTAIINVSTAGKVRVSSVNETTNKEEFTRVYDLDAGDYSININHSGGTWDDQTRVVFETATGTVISLGKTIDYSTADTLAASADLSGRSTARIVIGNRINVNAEWYVDEDGNYGGAGSLITHPNDVIKKYLVTEKGAALGDIDNTSFDAAGTAYAAAISGGYALAFILDVSIDEDQMAFESRSVIYMTGGKYFLDIVPDTAPAASITIDEDDCIGDEMTFNHGKIEDLYTDYTCSFGLKPSGEWKGVITAADAGNKYGVRKKSIELSLINFELMAQNVLDNILLQHQDLYKTVICDVGWKIIKGLQIGDTFDIISSLHNGDKFFVESIVNKNDKILTISGKGWW